MELKLENIKKSFYEDDKLIFCLDLPTINLSFGEVVYILGKNGSGKSVFIKLLNEELYPDIQFVSKIDDEKIDFSEVNTSLVRQKVEDNLFLDLTIEENILSRLEVTNCLDYFFPKQRLKGQLNNKIKNNNFLKEKINQPVSDLSGGQKQILAFALSEMENAKIICLDEFLSAVDYDTSFRLREKIRNYAKESNKIVIVISHDFEHALHDADRILIFENGKIIRDFRSNSENWNVDYIIQSIYKTSAD